MSTIGPMQPKTLQGLRGDIDQKGFGQSIQSYDDPRIDGFRQSCRQGGDPALDLARSMRTTASQNDWRAIESPEGPALELGNTNPHSDFARQYLQYDRTTQGVLLTSIVPGLFGGMIESALFSPDGQVKVQSGYGGFRDSA